VRCKRRFAPAQPPPTHSGSRLVAGYGARHWTKARVRQRGAASQQVLEVVEDQARVAWARRNDERETGIAPGDKVQIDRATVGLPTARPLRRELE